MTLHQPFCDFELTKEDRAAIHAAYLAQLDGMKVGDILRVGTIRVVRVEGGFEYYRTEGSRS